MVGEKIVYSIKEGAELWEQLSSQEMSCQVECHSTQEKTTWETKNSSKQTDHMIEDFIEKCEREAAKLEITVDYYIKEFVVDF